MEVKFVEDKPTGSWESVQSKSGEEPPLRGAHAQAVLNESVFIFGGRSGVMMDE